MRFNFFVFQILINVTLLLYCSTDSMGNELEVVAAQEQAELAAQEQAKVAAQEQAELAAQEQAKMAAQEQVQVAPGNIINDAHAPVYVDPANVIEGDQHAPANPDKITEHVQPKEKKFRFAKENDYDEFKPSQGDKFDE